MRKQRTFPKPMSVKFDDADVAQFVWQYLTIGVVAALLMVHWLQ